LIPGLFGYILLVAKSAFLGMRIPSELKKQLEQIARREERSISQICEVLLREGAAAYQKEGSKYIQRILARRKDASEQE
jgi:predicted transcriptional regulator